MLVYFAILLTALLGISGLVIDVGRIELRSLQLQSAADSAALSAAAEYQRTSNMTTATNAANSELATFASLNGIPMPSATVTLGATSGYYKNDGSTLQVGVTQPVSTTMLSLIKGSHSTINAGATAVAMIPPCVYLMGHPSFVDGNDLYLASQTFNLTCPIYAATGYTVDGFSHIHNWQAKTSGTASQSNGGGGTISPTLIANAPVLTDPLAYINSPVFSACDYHNAQYTPTTPTPITLIPGTYCGGLTITNTTVTLQPGRYIITGPVNITAGAIVNGPGVTIFLTKGGGSSYGIFTANNSTLNLSAPTDASNRGIPGVVLMTDRNWSLGLQDISMAFTTFKGDGLFYITGTGIYSWHCNMSGYHYFSFVAANFYFFASGLAFSCDYSQLPGGNPFRTVISLVQ